MPLNQKLSQIKDLTELFFQKLTFRPIIVEVSLKENVVEVGVTLEEPQALIGQKGMILSIVQNLLYKILKRHIKEEFLLDLDINEYKAKKLAYLKEMANSLADEVALTKEEKELEPMPAYQRRVIHLELAKRNDVVTESQGEEPERRIVIKPAR